MTRWEELRGMTISALTDLVLEREAEVERLLEAEGRDLQCKASLRAEVDRLRADTDTHDQAYQIMVADNEDLRAEVERLQEHMRALADTSVDRDTAGIFKGLWQGSEKECDELRADNDRLLAALQDIAEDPYAVDGGAAEIARRALEPKS